MTKRVESMCPHCGWRFDVLLGHANNGLVPRHDFGGGACLGTDQVPRNPESDRRPLWEDLRGHTDATVKVASGEWTAREHDGGSWEVLDAAGESQARFANARLMALHLATALEEVRRLRTGLGMVAQIIHGSTRVTRMIAEATLAGANLLDEDVAIDVCEGHWRKPASDGRPPC